MYYTKHKRCVKLYSTNNKEATQMSTLKTPFKYDFVGSFLRPQALKDAKSKYKNNEISQEEYDKIVNDEITNL